MKNPFPRPRAATIRPLERVTRVLLLSLALSVSTRPALSADSPKSFASTEAAVAELARAVNSEDLNALKSIFGPELAQITSPDPVQAKNDYARFAGSLKTAHRIVSESEDRAVLETGEEQVPFPVPLVKRDGGWIFDTGAGIEEIVNRRIGRNELDVLESMRAYVAAQREYAGQDRDGDEVLEYAQLLISSSGATDGLYWPPDLIDGISPLGPHLAFAQESGYVIPDDGTKAGPQPFHGYYFRILTKQGKAAPGGRYDYVINGNMIGGFALIAWPAVYDETGIMTFIVNQQGRVYQRDLGPDTEKEVKRIKEYNPDERWTVSPD